MTIINLDNPVTRHYEQKLADKDLEIDRLKKAVYGYKTQIQAIKGVNSMLQLQIHDLLSKLKDVSTVIAQVEQNLEELKNQLPKDI